MSGRVGGISILRVLPALPFNTSPILSAHYAAFLASISTPRILLMYSISMLKSSYFMSGVSSFRDLSDSYITSTCSTLCCMPPLQYSENYAAIIERQTLAFRRSVAVISTKTSVVSRVIFVASELMIGGSESTYLD